MSSRRPGRRVAAIALGCGLVALLVGIAIAASSGDDRKTATGTGATSTSTTLPPDQEAAAAIQQATDAQAAADKASADQAADRASADQAAADMAAAEQVAAENAAAEAAAAAQTAAESADNAPRSFSGAESSLTDRFTLVRSRYHVSWAATGSPSFVVRILGSSGSVQDLVSRPLPDPPSGETFFDSPGGEFSLDVQAPNGTWTVTLTKL